MSSYHSSFSYLGQNLREFNGYNLMISHFDADVGEFETGLATESIYTRSSDGTRRNLYGVKYSDPEPLSITILKKTGDEFSIEETRAILKWLTGSNSDSWLDLYIGDEVRYRLLGHVQNIKQYKMDAKIIGFVITFESASPFAYSAPQYLPDPTESEWYTISGDTNVIEINNESDDLYSYVYLNTTFENTTGDTLKIINTSIDNEETEILNLSENEIININNNMMITSDKPARTFGSSFNFIFPRLRPGENKFNISGNGKIKFEYIYPIKVADCIGAMKAIQDPICDPNTGQIILDTLSWYRISEKPTTLKGYGLESEVNALISSIKVEIDKEQLNTMLTNILN